MYERTVRAALGDQLVGFVHVNPQLTREQWVVKLHPAVRIYSYIGLMFAVSFFALVCAESFSSPRREIVSFGCTYGLLRVWFVKPPRAFGTLLILDNQAMAVGSYCTNR